MINIQKMMQQAQEVQFKLQEMQEKLKALGQCRMFGTLL